MVKKFWWVFMPHNVVGAAAFFRLTLHISDRISTDISKFLMEKIMGAQNLLLPFTFRKMGD